MHSHPHHHHHQHLELLGVSLQLFCLVLQVLQLALPLHDLVHVASHDVGHLVHLVLGLLHVYCFPVSHSDTAAVTLASVSTGGQARTTGSSTGLY